MIPQYEPMIRPEYAEAVAAQVASGWLGSGVRVEEFEQELAQVVGVKHIIATTSGTTALIMAIHSLGLKPGSTILFPDYTMLAGANAARFLGYNVRLVDISYDTLCMNPPTMEASIDGKVSAVIFVNQNGYVGPDVQRIRQLCDFYQLPMIEDSCQGLGIPGCGRTGVIGTLSFSVPKLITTGQGGAVFTGDDDLAVKLRRLRDQGDNWRKTKIHEFLGVNFKFNDIQAALGLAQLRILPILLEKRREIWDRYREHLSIVDYGLDSTWMVLYRSGHVDAIIEALAQEGIQAVRHYRPIHMNPPYETPFQQYPAAELIYKELVYLPSSLMLTRDEIDKICVIVKAVEQHG